MKSLPAHRGLRPAIKGDEAGVKEAEADKGTPGVTRPSGTVTVEPVEHLSRYWRAAGSRLAWECPFMLPPWLGAWKSSFGKDLKAFLYVVREGRAVRGLAPVTLSGDMACLIGDPELIDYSDFVIQPSGEAAFFSLLFGHLRREGVRGVCAERLRADSPALSFLRGHEEDLGCEVTCRPVDILYEMELPGSWEAYLELLAAKERHETRRKLRRLEEGGKAALRVIEDASDLPAAMDTFITLFRSNRPDKAQFMTGAVESFFRGLAVQTAAAGLLRIFALDLNDAPAAMALCFDDASTVYLYNNGFDRRVSHLSVGLLSKVLSIRDSILRGRKKYSFLRGGEPYKRRLGGRPVRLLQCQVRLT